MPSRSLEEPTVQANRGRILLLVVCALVVLSLGSAVSSNAVIAPPWCGTPIPDATGSLPDGSDPGDPAGSFAHIPYYAFACTLDDIQARSNGRMDVEVLGQSALGRDLYLVTSTRSIRISSARTSRPGSTSARSR